MDGSIYSNKDIRCVEGFQAGNVSKLYGGNTGEVSWTSLAIREDSKNGAILQLERKNDYSYTEVNLYKRNDNDNNTLYGTMLHTGNYASVLDPKYVKKTGDVMTGTLWINNADGVFLQKNGQNWIGLTRDGNGNQVYGLWDCLTNRWLLYSNGAMSYYHGKWIPYIYGTQWRGCLDDLVNAGAFSDFSAYTNSMFLPFYAMKMSDVTYVIGGECQNRVFGLYMFQNSSTGNGWNSALYMEPSGIVRSAGALYGAVWNDYAEYRKAESIEPGRCVVEHTSKEMKLSTERLQPGAEIISDTFGFAIGETDECKTPIAATGRVLAYPYEDRDSYPLGAAVCSGPNGTVSLMTREEIKEYPERIIGTVSEIPDYEEWGTGKAKVDGRIWIRIR